MAYKINQNKCIKCGSCVSACPVGAISVQNEKVVINPKICISCGLCFSVCPTEAPEPQE